MRSAIEGRGGFCLGFLRALQVVFFMGIIALCAAPVAAGGSTIYVKANAAGANNGTSWKDAYTKLQDALAVATSGTQIWVAEGVYYPDEGAGLTDNDPSERFNMKSGVEIYGGFAGTESSLTARDWKAHKSILSGDIAQDDANADGNHIDETWADIAGTNTDSVVLAEGITNARLDGFTVTGGSSSQYGGGIYDDNNTGNLFSNLEVRGNYAYYYGGGMFVNHVDSHIDNLLFEGNSTYPNSSFCYGGGLMSNCASATLTNVTFRNNRADMGGGIGVWPGGITVEGALFEQNTSIDYGGAVTIWDGTSSTFGDVTFSENVGEIGAGCYFFRGGTVSMTGATFSGNHVSYSTGVAHEGGGIKIASVDLTLTNATFAANQAEEGAGLAVENATANVTNAVFQGNYSVYGGGAVYGDYSAHTNIFNSSFNGNSASTGYGGGAIFSCSVDSGNPNSLTLANCVLWGDTASSGDGTREILAFVDYGGGFQCTSTASVTYCDVWLSSGVYSGTGNINADPKYVSPITVSAPTTTGDLHLQATSPAIDAGNNTVVTQLLDLNYQPRRMDVPGAPDTGSGTPPVVDMGAYEYPGNPPAVGDLKIYKGDSDGDGNDDAHLIWGSISGAVRYLVLRSPNDKGGFSQIQQVTGTEAYDVDALASPGSYYYSVVPLGY